MPLSGQKFKELYKALLSAFSNIGSLRLMVRIGLEANLDDISIRGSLQEIVHDLIDWAERSGTVEKLVTAARSENPTNPLLKTFRLDSQIAGAKSSRRVVHLPQRASIFFLDANQIFQKIECAFQKVACVALHGIGGIGKSEAAGQYGHRAADRYAGGVFWIAAPDIETARDSLAALAGSDHLALSLPSDATRDDRLHAVRRELATREHCLLIYDNMDWLAELTAEECPGVDAEFFAVQATSHILVTARPLVSHPRFQTIDLADLPAEDAALLLVRHARRDPELTSLDPLAPGETEAARQLAALFEGLPLALEQAGATIAEDGVMSLSDYLERYQSEEGRKLRERGARFGSHRSVFYTFEEAYRRINVQAPDAAELLRLCAFLSPDAIPIHLLAPVLFEEESETRTREALRVAVRNRLMDYDTGTKLASLHRVVQAVLTDLLSESERHDCKVQTVAALSAVFPSGKVETWAECELLLTHALLAARWIKEEEIETTTAALLLNQTAYYLNEQARYATALPLYERALAIYEKMSGAEHPNTAQILNNLAVLYKTQGDYDKALPLYERALAIYEKMSGAEHPSTRTVRENRDILLAEMQ